MVEQNISVITQGKDAGLNQLLKRISYSLMVVEEGLERVFRFDMRDGPMGRGMKWVDNLNKDVKNSMNDVGKSTKKAKEQIKKIYVASGNLTNAWLGMMFFGMNLTRLFSSMLKPAAELMGIFDVWTATLQTLFLPIMELIAPILFSIMETFMNLSPEMKVAIGTFALVGLVLGKILFIVGSVALGVAALGFLFGVTAGTALLAFGGIILAVVAVIAVIVGIVMAIRNWGKIVEWFKSIWAIFTLFLRDKFGAFKDKFKEIWENVKEIFSQAIESIKDFFRPIVNWINDKIISPIGVLFMTLAQFIGNIFYNIAEGIKRVINNVIRGLNVITGIFGVELATSKENEYKTMNLSEIKQGVVNNITIQQTNNATTSNKDEINAVVAENNKRLVDEVNKLIK